MRKCIFCICRFQFLSILVQSNTCNLSASLLGSSPKSWDRIHPSVERIEMIGILVVCIKSIQVQIIVMISCGWCLECRIGIVFCWNFLNHQSLHFLPPRVDSTDCQWIQSFGSIQFVNLVYRQVQMNRETHTLSFNLSRFPKLKLVAEKHPSWASSRLHLTTVFRSWSTRWNCLTKGLISNFTKVGGTSAATKSIFSSFLH